MTFWEFSPKGIPHRRAGKMLVAFWSPRDGDQWDRLLVTKRQQAIGRKSQCKIYPLEEGMQVKRLGHKWFLTEDERELLEKVNWWLKKNIKGAVLTRKELIGKRRKK